MNENINFFNKKIIPAYDKDFVRMTDLKPPSSTMLFADGGGRPGGFTPVPYTIPGLLSFISPRHSRGGRKTTTGELTDLVQTLGANICFADGHVEWMSMLAIPQLPADGQYRLFWNLN